MMYSLAESVDVFVQEKVGVLASAIGLYSKCYQRYIYIAVCTHQLSYSESCSTKENTLHQLYF